jgi:hypothetical protein
VPDFFHLTCRHRAGKVTIEGQVVPQPQPVLGDMALAWFTNMPNARNVALGLTSHTLKCDRTERKFLVLEPEKLFRWNDIRAVLPREGVIALEAAHGTRPEWWLVSQEPVRVEPVPR